MTNKERYIEICENKYVPIYSRPWWMDITCGAENWDVWLCNMSGTIVAAMPYYLETRGPYKYITKAPFTQTNGIQFFLNENSGPIAIAEMQERIINQACAFIESLGVDVYEQQYHYSFDNWQPFFWNKYTNTLRYTYVIEDAADPEAVLAGFSTNYRTKTRKGQRSTRVSEAISLERFYCEHDKIFAKQGLPSPLSREMWTRLYTECTAHGAGKAICALDETGNIHSIMFNIWDEKTMYFLLGGSMPEFSSSQSFPALMYYSICQAGQMGLSCDFEGSMIQRIAHSFRQYGGVPKPYYRIRKVFNPEIVRQEAEDYIRLCAKHE